MEYAGPSHFHVLDNVTHPDLPVVLEKQNLSIFGF